jgi:anti-anti-sigma factor
MAEDKLLVKKTGTTLYIYLGYQLSVENAPDLQEELNAYQNHDIEEIVFDATNLVHLSSIGIRIIVFAHNKFKHEPKIVFVNCAKAIYDTLDLVGITNMIHFIEAEPSDSESSDNEWHEKLEELRNKDLEDFAAHNDVVVYQMKLGQKDED